MNLDRDVCYRALLTRDPRFDGQFLVAVRTTGIYCRPICPAQTPKLEHVIFLPSAAAAQAAGFRPCLRCRPETSPDLAAWHGTAATVSRGMALIAGGALNAASVDELATRLGLGERQLRRLFQQHIGASPQAVAQTRRVLFAKQLITDTTMPMTEVALAAGFGSVRRFNDTFRTLYGRSPRSMRRARGEDTPASAITLTLPFKPPYDWGAIIGFLAARAIRGVEAVRPDCYARSIALGGAQGTIVVRPADRPNALVATIRFPVVTALPAIVARIRRVFDLGADPTVIGAHLAEDPVMAPLVAARPGLRVPGAWDGFELAVRGILGQQITVGAATALAGKLVALCGTALPPADDPALAGLTHAFPSPDVVAQIEDLGLAIGMPRARAAAITGMARAAAADASLFEPGRGLDEAIPRLCALPGIGEWTAQYIAMRALREPDAFPAADIGLLRAMARDGARPTPAQLLAHAEAWRPWRAYAALHLWASDAAAPRPATKEPPHAIVRRTRPVADRHHSPDL
ncbi:MAG TPA: AlkA N-terminal domain-containing protein [Acetobacteraceae bacterium]|jgi:AraC family transcriptional regulator of adaptative response / DNA-3-methyladenine glycosylase II